MFVLGGKGFHMSNYMIIDIRSCSSMAILLLLFFRLLLILLVDMNYRSLISIWFPLPSFLLRYVDFEIAKNF